MRARDKRTTKKKGQVLMFYPLGKNLEKTQGGVATTPPPELPRVNHDP